MTKIVFFVLGAFLSITSPALARGPVVLGMDRLDTGESRALLAGKRWAVLSHPASRGTDGEHLVDSLFRRQSELGLKLVSLFAPEHGFRGEADLPVPDSIDLKTGLPVFSLYGPRLAPTADQLSAVDGVLIDLQDVGVRYYTFSTTMALVMKACRTAGKKVVILDRPNPVGGTRWEGAILERALQGGFAAYYPIPTVHGMTMGELARLYNSAFAIDADLAVVPMTGWTRETLWRETGLPWIPPSPALMEPEQAELYSFVGTFESMNLAVGRGLTNERAFRIFGAPWITSAESLELVARLNRLALPGLTFRTAAWTPSRSVFTGKPSRGFEILMPDFRAVEGFASFLAITTTMRELFGSRLDLSKMDPMVGRKWIREAIEAGTPWSQILAKSRAETSVFDASRAASLLY